MKLCFQSLEIENFKAFIGAPVVLDFSSMSVGVHFIKGQNDVEPSLGSNGAGKTTINDALVWCLYGKTPDGLRNPDIRPWFGNGQTRVAVKLSRDGEDFAIIRTASPNSLQINGEHVGQEQIDRSLMSFHTFTHTILLGQGRPLFLDLTPQNKLLLFNDVLDLDRWDRRSKFASETVDSLGSEYTKYDVELTSIHLSMMEYKKSCSRLRQMAREWEEQRRTRLKVVEKEVRRLQPKVDQLRLQVEDHQSKYDNALVELRATRKMMNEAHEKRTRLVRNQQRREIEIDRLKQRLRVIKKSLNSLRTTDICPTCGQSVRKKDLSSHRNELRRERAEVNEKLLSFMVDQVEDDGTDSIDDQVSALEKAMEDFNNQVEETGRWLDHWLPIYSEMKAKLDQSEKQLKTWVEEDNPHWKEYRIFRKRLSEQKVRIKELQGVMKKLRSKIDKTRFWVKGFKECRLYSLEEVLAELQIVSNALCPELGLDNWMIEYSVEKDTKSGTTQRALNVEIHSPGLEKMVKWESFSGGESQRLRLVGALALSETLLNHAGIDTDVEILDEPTRHLSVEGIYDLASHLPDRARRLQRRTLYVDHQVIEGSYFSSVILVHRSADGVTLTSS